MSSDNFILIEMITIRIGLPVLNGCKYNMLRSLPYVNFDEHSNELIKMVWKHFGTFNWDLRRKTLKVKHRSVERPKQVEKNSALFLDCVSFWMWR